MERNETYYTDLVTRYLSGEAGPGEVKELSAWVSEDASNRKLFEDYLHTWETVEQARIESTTDPDTEWKQFAKMLHAGESRQTEVIRMVPRRPALTGVWRVALRIAAMFLILLIPSWFAFRWLQNHPKMELIASKGIIQQVLPDGSLVVMNQGAKISYPEKFRGDKRPLTLEGEAWFDIAHDKSKPFVITAGKARIEVVGTTFYISTTAEMGKTEVVLETGVVRIYPGDGRAEPVIISPGERAEISEGRITVAENTDPNLMAWRTRQLTFTDTPLDEVAATLGRVYNCSVTVASPGPGKCTITASFDNQSLESVLNVIRATLDLEIRKTGDRITISGHGCE